MDELVPVLLGAALGVVVWSTAGGRSRAVLSILAVIFSAGAATIASGEYQQSWFYLLLDLGEALLGFALGVCLATRLRIKRSTGKRATAEP
jgi:hypothetical protein